MAGTDLVALRSIGTVPEFKTAVASRHWYREEHGQEVTELLGALAIADRQGISSQSQIYRSGIIDLVGKDMAVEAQDVIKERGNYPARVFELPGFGPEVRQHLATQQLFTVPEGRRRHDSYTNRTIWKEWRYVPMRTYPKPVPPNSLYRLGVLEDAGLMPEESWVGDLVRRTTSHDTKILIDPRAAAQYGRWFVIIAEWE